jgi:hypothetical protein
MADQNILNSLLISASRIGDPDAVKVHLTSGADVHAEHDQALRSASKDGHTETVEPWSTK